MEWFDCNYLRHVVLAIVSMLVTSCLFWGKWSWWNVTLEAVILPVRQGTALDLRAYNWGDIQLYTDK